MFIPYLISKVKISRSAYKYVGFMDYVIYFVGQKSSDVPTNSWGYEIHFVSI